MFKIENVNEDNFKDIPGMCKYCLYWQASGAFGEDMLKPEMEREKRAWLNKVTKEFENCVKIAYFNNVPTGFMQCAPARFFPRAKEYVSGPPSEDAILIACLYIPNKEARGKGIGTAMLKELLAELKTRKVKAVETFAGKSSENNPSGPLKLYLKHNFKTIREKDGFPLLRLDL